MAENSVFSNETGQVMFGTGGQIYKVSYSFGNAFANRMGLNNYIEIGNLNLPTHCNVLQWISNPHTSGAGLIYPFFNLQAGTDNFYLSLVTLSSGLIGYHKNSDPAAGLTPIVNYNGASVIQKNMCYSTIARTDGTSTLMAHTSLLKNQTYTVSNLVNYTKLFIGAGRNSSGNTPNRFGIATTKYNRFSIFNRELSPYEYLFYVSNLNGNEFLTKIGIEIDLKCDVAEILDFSTLQDGSNMRVGVRDYSGNNHHGQIMNLPVGSLADQLSYANANLFVPFIS